MAKTTGKPVEKSVKQPEKVKQKKESFALGKENYILIAVGMFIMLIGYIIMAGTENIFSFGNTSLPVIIIIFGFLFVFYAIIKKPKDSSDQSA